MDRTEGVYGLLWEKNNVLPIERWHFNKMQEVIPEPIVKGSMGIEVGSGCGYDTYIMAKGNPSVKILSLDISGGVYKIKELVSGLQNVWVINGSVADLPLRDNTFDFAYSYGVLHHTSEPKDSLKEIARIIKKGAAVYVYLYEDHADNQFKHSAIKIMRAVRIISTKMPLQILYFLSVSLSPLAFILFTLSSKILRKIKFTRRLSDKIPFNFGTHPFSLAGDIYDRLGAPIEHRFNREEVFKMFNKCGFSDITVTKLRDTAGWVAWGYKK